ncbi:MAG: nucleoside triphosphate pyrophosphohydrolase [Saprospiraceae bacterium]|nr:nucleoside triphosphate pyrophosphohydrolase [Saprospiraceae bacterium]
MENEKLVHEFLRLVKIMDELREQCPWDKKQTIHTLRSLTIEETYELADAIILEDYKSIKEELGDLFLHLLFYSRIGKEQEKFNLTEVLSSVSEKLIRRHPHIYGNTKVENEDDVKRNWEMIKKEEGKSLLAGVPNSLPSIVKAIRLQEKTAQVGFEWENMNQVWVKVEEEIGELKEALAKNDGVEEEFGDLLFALVNYARFIKVDPETALEKCNKKFKSRFEFIEKHAPKPLTEMSLEEMDELWEKAKLKL